MQDLCTRCGYQAREGRTLCFTCAETLAVAIPPRAIASEEGPATDSVDGPVVHFGGSELVELLARELRDAVVVPPGRVWVHRDQGSRRVAAQTRGFGALSGTAAGAVGLVAAATELALEGLGPFLYPAAAVALIGGVIGALGWWSTERLEISITPRTIVRLGPEGSSAEWPVMSSTDFGWEEVTHPRFGNVVGYRLVVGDPDDRRPLGIFTVARDLAERIVAQLRAALEEARDARGYRD